MMTKSRFEDKRSHLDELTVWEAKLVQILADCERDGDDAAAEVCRDHLTQVRALLRQLRDIWQAEGGDDVPAGPRNRRGDPA